MKMTHKKPAPKTKNAKKFNLPLLEWKGPEYIHHEKSMIWFVVAGVVLFALVAWGMSSGAWTFSLAMLAFAGAYYSMHRHTPKRVNIKVSKAGIKVGRHIYSYQEMKGFWVIWNPPYNEKLYIRMSSRFQPDIPLAIEGVDYQELRKILKQFIPELTHNHEPFADTLIRLFRL